MHEARSYPRSAYRLFLHRDGSIPCPRRRARPAARRRRTVLRAVAVDLEAVDAPAHEGPTVDEGREVPRVAGQAPVARVEVEQRARAIAGDGLGVDLDDLGAQGTGAEAERLAHDAAHAVAAEDDAGAHRPVRRVEEHALLCLVTHRQHAHAIAHPDASGGDEPRERMVELDPPHDAPDPTGRRARLRVPPAERDPVDPRRRHVDVRAEGAQELVPPLAQAAGARLLARVARLLEHQHARRKLRPRLHERERRRRPGRAASHDDDVLHEGALYNRSPPPSPRRLRHGAFPAPRPQSEHALTQQRARSRQRQHRQDVPDDDVQRRRVAAVKLDAQSPPRPGRGAESRARQPRRDRDRSPGATRRTRGTAPARRRA